MTRKHGDYFTALHVAQEARKAGGAVVDTDQCPTADGHAALPISAAAGAPNTQNLDRAFAVIDRHAAPERGPADSFQIICKLHGLPVPLTEYRFHPTRMWRFDYAWPEVKLALEVEGGVWRKGGGAHSHPLNIERDLQKYSEAAILGWRVLRVATEHLGGAGIDYARRAIL